MSDQKHDVYHCMASTREMKSLDNDMLMEACENLKHSWHEWSCSFKQDCRQASQHP